MGTTGLKEKIVLFRELFFGRFSLALRVLLAHSAVKCFLESSTWNDMDKLVIRGGTPLLGTVRISGAKNAALPWMAAALLTEDTVILENIPQVRDIETTRRLLSAMGAEVELGYGRAHHRTTIQTRNLAAPEASYELVKTMRASTLVLGPLLARCGRARVSLTGGDVKVTNCDPEHLTAIVQKLQEAGVKTSHNADSIRVMGDNPLKAADVNTEEYPGFPTDMQAQYMVVATQAQGTSIVTENIFENRFMHAQELVRMGANIRIEGRRAIVRGKTPLSAAAVLASDLRASASLVLAALVADGETIIDRVYHIDRGYEHIEEKLKGIGAEIRRIGEMFPKKAAAPNRG